MDGHFLKCDNKCKTTSPLCFSPRAADDQAPVQTSGLRAWGREGHPRARLLQTHRLGTPGEQGDTAAVQAQSGKWLPPCTLTAGRSSGFWVCALFNYRHQSTGCLSLHWDELSETKSSDWNVGHSFLPHCKDEYVCMILWNDGGPCAFS